MNNIISDGETISPRAVTNLKQTDLNAKNSTQTHALIEAKNLHKLSFDNDFFFFCFRWARDGRNFPQKQKVKADRL